LIRPAASLHSYRWRSPPVRGNTITLYDRDARCETGRSVSRSTSSRDGQIQKYSHRL